jgi:hypothetical protein
MDAGVDHRAASYGADGEASSWALLVSFVFFVVKIFGKPQAIRPASRVQGGEAALGYGGRQRFRPDSGDV